MTASSPTPPTETALAALLGDDRPPAWWQRPALWIGLGAVVLCGGGLAYWLASRQDATAPVYVTEPVRRGNLTLSVAANGTLQPTRAVAIGSELSGTVRAVYVDVNDRVRRGQVLVQLDTAKLTDQVLRSRAALAATQAQLAQAGATRQEAEGTLARLEEAARLSGGRVPAATELDSARAAVQRARAAEDSARAGVAEAQATLSTDETNLSKAAIRSPIDGVVLSRSVDPGNAVAASLQAVTLFNIAEDLTRLKAEVAVDEADVGAVQPGQKASFTVSAYPSRRYPATITRVAWGSTKTDNVVTYTATLDVANGDLSLRPGMTAAATIISTERNGVLLVPNTALRFTPLQAGGAATAASSGSVMSRLMPRPPRDSARRPGGAAPLPGGTRQLWVLRDGQPVAVQVKAGISDGRQTEVSGPSLAEGTPVITDQRSAGAAR